MVSVMSEDRSSEETAVLATYSNRQDAEVVRAFLEDRGITTFIAADDVHPPLQLTEGVRLLVLSGEASRARDALAEGGLASSQEPTMAAPTLGGHSHGLRSDDPKKAIGRPARLTAWAYIALSVLIIAIIAALLLAP